MNTDNRNDSLRGQEYSVELWGSNPDLGNDDCFIGADFGTLGAANHFFENPWVNVHFDRCKANVEYIVLSGPDDVCVMKKNKHYKPDAHNDDWKREIAMQAGMMGGVNAYNEVMGY